MKRDLTAFIDEQTRLIQKTLTREAEKAKVLFVGEQLVFSITLTNVSIVVPGQKRRKKNQLVQTSEISSEAWENLLQLSWSGKERIVLETLHNASGSPVQSIKLAAALGLGMFNSDQLLSLNYKLRKLSLRVFASSSGRIVEQSYWQLVQITTEAKPR